MKSLDVKLVVGIVKVDGTCYTNGIFCGNKPELITAIN